MLQNIREHSLVVAKVTHFLSRRLSRIYPISAERATMGALLHDIGKTRSLKTGEDHCRLGKEICLCHGLDFIAEIVEEHVRLKAFPYDGKITEKAIVYYSDKRVRHSEIVTLEERLKDILKRYAKGRPDYEDRIIENFSLSKRLEDLLFQGLDIRPEDLRLYVEGEEIIGLDMRLP